MWQYTLPIISARPWLGFGPEPFSLAYLRSYPEGTASALKKVDAWDPQNWSLYHLISVGVLRFFAFAWLQVRIFAKGIAALRRYDSQALQISTAAVLGAGTAYLAQVYFNPTAIAPAAIYWLVLALDAALIDDENSGSPGSNSSPEVMGWMRN